MPVTPRGSAAVPSGYRQAQPRTNGDIVDLAADFAILAARTEDLPALEQEICRVAAAGLRVRFAKLLVYKPDQDDFLLQAGVGWEAGIVGRTRLGADVGTAAGFAWHTGQSIISNNLSSDRRFRVPDLLSHHGILRCINVVVPGPGEEPFGILEVESQESGAFTLHDVGFLQLLAHSFSAYLRETALRSMFEEQAARETERHADQLHELQHRVRNDLQVIYSVIDQEARDSAAGAGAIGFKRVGRRILAIGSLYDHLLGQSETTRVEMGAYLQKLCRKISEAAELDRLSIELVAQTETVFMPVDRSVRIGVAVNELVINAVEHAFVGGAPGRILVRLVETAREGGLVSSVSVSDDGLGFSGPRFGSNGLRFVERLVRQAGGALHRVDGAGTHWTIELSP